METVSISRFKATCLALLARVQKTGEPLLVTKRGVPVAQVLPPPEAEPPEGGAFGAMADSLEIVEDVIEPLGEGDWEVYR